MRFLLLLIYSSTHIVRVKTEAKGKVILRDGENPCEGHVEIYYNNTAGYVGDKHWDTSAEEVVCRTTRCGVPVPSATQNVQRLDGTAVWLNELQCSGNESSLWDCAGYPAPGVSFYQKPTVKRIKCSDQIEISLEPQKCHGVAKYSVSGKTPSSGYFCKDKWGSQDTQTAELLCRNLGCGGFKEIPRPQWVTQSSYGRSEKMAVDCAGIDSVTNLWQCIRRTNQCNDPVVVTCEGHERLQLQGSPTNVCSGQLQEKKTQWKPVQKNITNADNLCKKLNCGSTTNYTYVDQNLHLTCTDTVKVVLMNNNRESKCFGQVHVNVNGLNKAVCGGGWTEKNSQMICQELNCGKLIEWSNRGAGAPGVMDYVECLGDESSLWHCNARRGQQLLCQGTPHIICSGSVEFRLADGPGKCAGRLDVQHGGVWKKVTKSGWDEKYSDNICQRLNCGETTAENHPEKFFQGSGNFVSVKCDRNQPDISECVKSEQSTRNEEAVGITCENHEVVFLDGSESCSGGVGIRQNNNTFWLSGSNETWNSEAAQTVCRQMHCGDLTKFYSRPSTEDMTDMTFRAYRCSGNQASLLHCDKVELPDHNETIAQVECSGTINMSLSNGCWGKVRILAEEKSGGVCADTWTEEMSRTLCRDQGCGDNVLKVRKPPSRERVLFKSLHTLGYNFTLRESTFVKMQPGGMCVPAYVVCAGSTKYRFRPSRDHCSGIVEASYEGDWLPLSSSLTTVGSKICKALECAEHEGEKTYFGPQHDGEAITSVDCSQSDSEDSLENCKISAGNQRSLLDLQCKDWREMTLEDRGCKGEVAVYSKAGRMLVSSEGWTRAEGERLLCNQKWDINYSNRVCQELSCGNAFDYSDSLSTKYGLYVSCDQHHHVLGQCRRTEGTCSSSVSVSCYKNITFRTKEKCGGLLQVNYGKRWENVCIGKDAPMNDNLINSLCKEINCEAKGPVKRTASKDISDGKKLNCPADYRDVKYCVSQDSCQKDQQVSIWCKGYIAKEPTPTPTPPPTSTILIGLGVSLVVLILIIVFVRNRILRRNRKSRVFPQMFPDGEDDLDSEMYEDIHKSDDMEEDFTQKRFSAETEFVRSGRAQSSSSLQYDDVDEVNEAHPLTPKGSTSASSRGNFDGAAYEVEDEPENYDDVEDISANVQTTVDIHDQLQVMPESSTAPPEGQQRDGDYLEPDQDG
ncbi:hypothetical protein OJAV_G00062080 [Oryzias javanicus]|uniref:SRCR domain-containing protein n=1 Tax=Oryzias javanicus TaxID=123683 RepID=A0A437D4V1_ORYJA|nr:hypothetical protein OJAV_G00062080 [Oryzias javanicus]